MWDRNMISRPPAGGTSARNAGERLRRMIPPAKSSARARAARDARPKWSCRPREAGLPTLTRRVGCAITTKTSMKITAVHTHVLEAKLSEPFAYSRAWYDTRTAMVVEITTDQGIVGWGECYGPARI